MDLVLRRVGNSFGVIIPRPLLEAWGVGEGDVLQATVAGIAPPRKRRNAQDALDELKRAIAVEVVKRHPPQAIRERALGNLARWKKQGVWSKAYDEWQALLRSGDDGELLKAMLGFDQRANRMRQSMPYTGMLPRELVQRLNEEASR
jgi:antitoxin component of MazEF toxin-antitoxin module